MKVPLINDRLQRQHLRAGFPAVFAGIDLSWDEYIPPQGAAILAGPRLRRCRRLREPLQKPLASDRDIMRSGG